MTPLTDQRPSLAALISQFRLTLSSDTEHSRRVARALGCWLNLLPVGLRVDEVDAPHIQSFIDHRLAEGFVPASAYWEVGVISKCLNFARAQFEALRQWSLPPIPRPRFWRRSALQIVDPDRQRELCLNCPLPDCVGVANPQCPIRIEARPQSLKARRATNAQRAARCQQRCVNETGYRGVRIIKRDLSKKFTAVIQHKGVTISLGGYHTAEEAARAYDAAARKLHGEFAALNFPPDQPS